MFLFVCFVLGRDLELDSDDYDLKAIQIFCCGLYVVASIDGLLLERTYFILSKLACSTCRYCRCLSHTPTILIVLPPPPPILPCNVSFERFIRPSPY